VFTDSVGCKDSSTKSIQVNDIPQVSISTLSSICTNENAFSLSGGSPAGGQYFINGQLNSTFAPSQFSQGSQTISYQLSNACGTDSVSASISVLSAPTAFAGNDTVINSGDIVSLNGVGISTSGSSI